MCCSTTLYISFHLLYRKKNLPSFNTTIAPLGIKQRSLWAQKIQLVRSSVQRKIFIDILVHIVPCAFLFLCQSPIKYIFRFHFNNSYFSSHTIVYHRTVNFHFSSSFSNVQGMPCAPLVFSDSFPPLYQKLLPIEVLCKKTDPHHISSTRKQGKWKLLVILQKQGCTR